jgi:8-oxo-dGTP diphosphatase
MITLTVQQNINLLPKPNTYYLTLDDKLPPLALITAAFGLIFDDDCFLMTRLKKRGWDIPGGHLEPGESPQETVRREIYEETAVHVGKLQLLGYDKFDIHAPVPVGYRYPYPISYQVFFWGRASSLEPFVATDEALERKLFTPAQARRTNWARKNQPLYEAALSRQTKK